MSVTKNAQSKSRRLQNVSRVALISLLCLPLMGQGYNIPFVPQPAGGCSPSVTPTIRAVSTAKAGTIEIALSLPAGLTDGDLALAFCETANEDSLTITDWTEVSCSPSATGATKLQVFRNSWNTGDNTTTSDSGNHQYCMTVAITAGTWDTGDPIDVCVASQQSATTAKDITGGTTTCGFDLVLAALGADLPDGNSTTEFSGEANANLANVTEEYDEAKTQGNGGAILLVSGDLEAAGATGNTTSTSVTTSDNGSITISINAVP